MKVIELTALAKERGLRGYSKLKKAELITFLQNNLRPHTRPTRPSRPPPPPPQMSTWESIDDRPSVRFRPDRPRQNVIPGSRDRSTCEPIDDRLLVRFRPDRPRQNVMPGLRDMDIFKQQEMRKNRPQVTSKLNEWHDWLVNHVPKTIKDKASRAFKTFKDKVMGLYNRVKGKKNTNTGNELNEKETRIKSYRRPDP